MFLFFNSITENGELHYDQRIETSGGSGCARHHLKKTNITISIHLPAGNSRTRMSVIYGVWERTEW